MEVKIEQWSTTESSNYTEVLVSIFEYVNENIKTKKQYTFSIKGKFNSINDEFENKVKEVVASMSKGE